MHEVVTDDGGARSRVGDGGADPAAGGIETVTPLLPIFPPLSDAHVLQIGAVSHGVVLGRVASDVLLVEGDVGRTCL